MVVEVTSSKKEDSIANLANRGWVSLRQLAFIMDVSYPTISRMKNDGRIKGLQVGGIYRIYAEEVRRLLQKGNANEDEG